MKCPCCGGDFNSPAEVRSLKYVRLPPLARKTLNVLMDVYPRALSRTQLADMVYSDDPNGGPDTAENAVSVYMARMRPRIEALGWTAGWDSTASGIRLQPLVNNTLTAGAA